MRAPHDNIPVMRSIKGGIGRAKAEPVHGKPPAARIPSSRKSPAPPAKTPFRVLAIVKDRVTGRPVGDASYDVVKKGQEGRILAAGTTGFQGTVDAPVASGGEYLVRVDYWSNCSDVKTNYVVTVNTRGKPPQVFTGFFTGSGDGGGKGSGRIITRTTY